jgi:hypothetical protein
MRKKQTSLIQAIQGSANEGRHGGIPWIHDVINPREEDPANKKPPRVHHIYPMGHQCTQTASKLCGHLQPP